MPQGVPLNNIDHRDLRIDTTRSAALGDATMSTPTFPGEFRHLQACYPIVFRRIADGGFQPLALFGLREGDNLFLDANGWQAPYIPMAIERQPFLIGRSEESLTLHVDIDSPRAGTNGEALFLEHGGSTEYLERTRSLLLALYDGLQATPAFVAALTAHDLLEPFVLDVTLDDGSQGRLSGFHSIAEDRLRALDGDAVAGLHAAGHLEPIYMAVASVSRFRDLIDRMNRRVAAG